MSVSPLVPSAPAAPFTPLAPEALHPSLWRAHQLARSRAVATASGWAALDAELPEGGWPHGQLTELLLPRPGLGEMRLLAPALAACQREGRCVMLFDPPAPLSARALAELGLAIEPLLLVHGRAGPRPAAQRALLPNPDVQWALEQALRSGHVGAVLAWLPERLRADALRRLQLAAQAHPGPVFLMREAAARARPSAAPLRLLLQPAGLDALSLRLLKRRGPPCAEPLTLPLAPVVAPPLRAALQARLAATEAITAASAAAGTADAPVALRPSRHSH